MLYGQSWPWGFGVSSTHYAEFVELWSFSSVEWRPFLFRGLPWREKAVDHMGEGLACGRCLCYSADTGLDPTEGQIWI